MIRAMTARVAPSDSEPESPMKIWAGWTLNHRKPEQRADDQGAQTRPGSAAAGALSRAMIRYGDEGEDEGPARQPVEAVGQVDAVAGGHDGEGGEDDVGIGADRRHRR